MELGLERLVAIAYGRVMIPRLVIGILIVCLLFISGCETSTQTTQVDPEAGLLRKVNPAALLNGSEVEMGGIVRVEKVDQTAISAPAYGASLRKNLELPVGKGAREVTLEGAFNRDGQMYVFRADMDFDVEPTCRYYPVAGYEITSGKAWLWIQDQDHEVRVSDRVEGKLVKTFEVAKANYLDDHLFQYESIIDPDVLAERIAACDRLQSPGYQLDESLDRGDLAYEDREDQ